MCVCMCACMYICVCVCMYMIIIHAYDMIKGSEPEVPQLLASRCTTMYSTAHAGAYDNT